VLLEVLLAGGGELHGNELEATVLEASIKPDGVQVRTQHHSTQIYNGTGRFYSIELHLLTPLKKGLVARSA
jgi:hypothetical protein